MSFSSGTLLSTSVLPQAAALSRRSFLRRSWQAGVAVVGLNVFAAEVWGQGLLKAPKSADGYFAIPAEAQADPLMKLRRADFVKVNGDYFETQADNGIPLIISLLRIEDLPEPQNLTTKRRVSEMELTRQRELSFSLIFRGPLEPALRQRTHRLKHPALGELELFLVPIGKDEGSRFYEVIFNRTHF